MRYLIFSDTHLTPKYEPKKFAALKEAIEQSDRVIINGDFWEGMSYKFEDFVTSSWSKELFPLLKKKQAVYLYGNHDDKDLSDERRGLFSVKQLKQFVFKSGPNTYYVEHGDLLLHFPSFPPMVRNTLEIIEHMIFIFFGKNFMQSGYKRSNNKIKKKIAERFKSKEFLITGHTHSAEIDLENHYINSGFNNFGLSQYLFIEDGVVSAVEKEYL